MSNKFTEDGDPIILIDSANLQCTDTGWRMAATNPVHYVIYGSLKLDPPQGRNNCLRRIITAFTAINTLEYRNILQTRCGRDKINLLINGFKLF